MASPSAGGHIDAGATGHRLRLPSGNTLYCSFSTLTRPETAGFAMMARDQHRAQLTEAGMHAHACVARQCQAATCAALHAEYQRAIRMALWCVALRRADLQRAGCHAPHLLDLPFRMHVLAATHTHVRWPLPYSRLHFADPTQTAMHRSCASHRMDDRQHRGKAWVPGQLLHELEALSS